MVCGGCSKPGVEVAVTSTSAPPDSNVGIEVEIVQSAAIEGSITATGKILVTEDGTASIGPVHEGRIVHLYAGQGSYVRKGQKLAELESSDIDEAEAAYLKALADLANATRTSTAEIKFAQADVRSDEIARSARDHAGEKSATSRTRS
jgi:cobalt-zinc-cadmium efflux system membrane fusion protein